MAAAHAQANTFCRYRTFRRAFARRCRPQASFCFSQVRQPFRAPTTAHLALARERHQLHNSARQRRRQHSRVSTLISPAGLQHSCISVAPAAQQSQHIARRRSGAQRCTRNAHFSSTAAASASSRAPAPARAARSHWHSHTQRARSSIRTRGTHALLALIRFAGIQSINQASCTT